MYAASSRDAWSTAIAEQICRDLLSDSPMMRSTAARTLADRTGVPLDAEVVAIVIAHRRAMPIMESAGTELAVAIDAVRRHADGFVILWAENRDGSISVICFDRITPGGSGVYERHVSRLVDTLLEQTQIKESSQIIVGVGPARNGVAEAWHSAQRAREALKVQQQLHSKGPLATWDELGVYQLLVQLDSARLSSDLIPPALARLFSVGGELLDTLETYLDAAGDVNATTAALHIHRSTLYYRLQKIRDDFGIDWRTGSSRLHIHVLLKLLRLHSSAYGGPPSGTRGIDTAFGGGHEDPETRPPEPYRHRFDDPGGIDPRRAHATLSPATAPGDVNPLPSCDDASYRGHINDQVEGKETTMGASDKFENAAENAKGKAKEAFGKATDDERMEAEGDMDQTKANLKQAGENVKDAFTKD